MRALSEVACCGFGAVVACPSQPEGTRFPVGADPRFRGQFLESALHACTFAGSDVRTTTADQPARIDNELLQHG